MNKFFSIFLMFFGAMSIAQNSEISGIVTDADTNEPLPFANIIIKGSQKGTSSDAHGNFKLEVSEGNYTLQVSFMGYEPKEFSAKVENNKKSIVKIGLSPESVSLEAVVVKTSVRRETETAILAQQRNAVVARQSIGSQELSRKGVSDAKGAVTKISGISKQEGVKNVFIRGLGDRYNSTTFNGFPIPSEDPEHKNISLDFFATDIIESVGVDKVFGVPMPSDVGGAIININSKKLSENQEFNIDFSFGGNSQVVSVDEFVKQNGVNFLGISQKNQPSENTKLYSFSNDLQPKTQNFLYNTSVGISGGKKFSLDENPLSIYGVLSHSSDVSFTDEIIRNTTSGGSIFLDQNGKKYKQNISQLGLLTASYGFKNHQLQYNAMLVHSNAQYVGIYQGKNADRYQDATNDFGQMVRQQNNENTLIINQLSSKWKTGEYSYIQAGVAHNFLNGNEPDRRVNNFSKLSESGDYKLTGSTGRQQRYFISLDKNDWNAQFSYHKHFANTNLTIGYNGRWVIDDFQAVEFDLQSQQMFNVNSLNLNDLYNQDKLNRGAFSIDRNFDSYKVNTFLHSLYSDVLVEINPDFKLNFGIKTEKTDVKVDYNVNRGGTKGTSQIAKLYLLPSLNLKYKLHEKHTLRLGSSKTYTLPQPKEISPYIYVDVSFKSQGNKDLKPSDNYHLDLKWDYYLNPSEIVSLSGFYKYIANPIARVEEGGSGGYLTYKNISPQATLGGIELEIRKNIFEKSTENSSQKWSFGWNASLIFTELEVNVANTQKRKSALEGVSPFITNADVSYHFQKGNKKIINSLIFNYFSDRIYTIGTLEYKDIIEKGIPTLDFVSSWQLTKNWSVKAQAKNILNTPISLEREVTGNTQEVVLNQYKKGIGVSVGIGYSF